MTRQTLTFDGVPLDAIEGESVLECLERHNYAISSGCRAGACQSCLLQAAEVDPPTSSITGLNKRMIRERLFMACQAKALEMFSVQTPTNATVETWDADVLGIKLIHHDVSLIQLGPKQPLAFQHGQFLKLSISGGLTRSYSIASSALDPNPKIEFHVRHVPHGAMTTYLANQLRIGDKVQLYGPFGAMEYDGDSPEKNLLLIGSGTGLGPLYSLATAALAKGHWGQIRLYHGGKRSRSLYFRSELSELADQFDNFVYIPCADQDLEFQDRAGSPVGAATSDQSDYSSWRVFAAGHPAMVKAAQKKLFLAGVSLRDIVCDPFADQSQAS